MMQMSHQQHQIHTGQVPVASQQNQQQQQHMMSHHQQDQHILGGQQQQPHMNMTQQHGLSASHNANGVPQSMVYVPRAQQPHHMHQQINRTQLQQHQPHQQQQQWAQLQQTPVVKQEVQIVPQVMHAPVDGNPLVCIRRGCTELAIKSIDWEDEYCSNECAVSHCRDAFTKFCKDGPVPN